MKFDITNRFMTNLIQAIVERISKLENIKRSVIYFVKETLDAHHIEAL